MYVQREMRFLCFFLFLLYLSPLYAATGSSDNRTYVDWSQPPYNKLVIFYDDTGLCTAQYVWYDIILTARHCVTQDDYFDNFEKIGTEYDIVLYNDTTTPVFLEKYGQNFQTDDWALLRIKDPKFYNKDFFYVPSTQQYTNVINAGFGYMRILSDEEIQQFRTVFNQMITQNQKANFTDLVDTLFTEAEKLGIKPLKDRAGTVDIKGYEWTKYRLKADTNCKIYKSNYYLEENIQTTCDNFSGNSGGAYFNGNTLLGVCSSGVDSFEDDKNEDFAVPVTKYFSALEEMKKTSPAFNTTTLAEQDTKPQDNIVAVAQNISDEPLKEVVSQIITEVSAPETNKIPAESNAESIAELETTVADIQQTLEEQLPSVPNMDNQTFVNFIDKLTEYSVLQENLRRAKERENSLANRILGAAAIGAAGFGGMQIASSLAEKQADLAAEQDMQAYIATMRCGYGDNKNIKYGENVVLPGGNELFNTVTEYKTLAADLKQRKEALGLAPGIESQTILDSAYTNLYDNTSQTEKQGVYTSVYNALTNEHGEDATEWNEQKADTQNKFNTGATVGGIGVIGGTIGNIIENKIYNKQN